jgi:ATP-binding cassette, subfamily B, multidrug efflux pump
MTSQPSRKDAPSRLLQRPFRYFMRQHPRAFVLGVISLLFTNLFDILTPLGLKMGIDAIENRSQGDLLWAIAAFLGLMAGVTVFRYLWRIYFGRFHHSVAEDLRNRIFAKLTELGPSFFQRKPVGELMSLITADVNAFRMAIGPGILILLDAVFLIAMILPVMIWLSWDWTWKTLILLPFLPFFIRRMETIIHERFRQQQDRLAAVSANAQEIVSGIRVIKSFAQENNQTRAFDDSSRQFEEACNRVAKADATFHPVMDGAVAMGAVILLWFGTDEVMKGAVTLGTFVAFHEYIKRMIWPMSAIGMSISMIEQGRASFGRIRDLLQTETDIPDSGEASLERFESIEISSLDFLYAGAPTNALTRIDLKIQAGETIGIVGPVGAGKTTLLQLMSRLYPVEAGKIRLNGQDLGSFKRADLTRMISYVPQEAFLFSDSIAENVAFGFEAFPGLEPVMEATNVVNMDHEIQTLPDRYDAQLGERGVNLSGGQKQRLTIARALIRTSSVLMLDDSLSAVDSNTEKAIVGSLREAREKNPDQTVILVSHRLATLRHADRIIVLNQGLIEAQGSHEELLAISPTYRHLHELQTAAPDAALIESALTDRLAGGNP